MYNCIKSIISFLIILSLCNVCVASQEINLDKKYIPYIKRGVLLVHVIDNTQKNTIDYLFKLAETTKNTLQTSKLMKVSFECCLSGIDQDLHNLKTTLDPKYTWRNITNILFGYDTVVYVVANLSKEDDNLTLNFDIKMYPYSNKLKRLSGLNNSSQQEIINKPIFHKTIKIINNNQSFDKILNELEIKLLNYLT